MFPRDEERVLNAFWVEEFAVVRSRSTATGSIYDSERLSSWLKQENVAGWWWGGVLPVTEILAIGPDLPRVSLPPVPIL